MSETVTLNPPVLTDAEYEAEIERYIQEMKQIAAEIAKREKGIEKLFAETDQLLSQLKVA